MSMVLVLWSNWQLISRGVPHGSVPRSVVLPLINGTDKSASYLSMTQNQGRSEVVGHRAAPPPHQDKLEDWLDRSLTVFSKAKRRVLQQHQDNPTQQRVLG